MKTKGKHLKCASISDIHLGNTNTPTVDMLARLRKAFPDNDETGQLDVIWLAGDIFDKQLALSDDNVFEIQLWMGHFLSICKKRDIVVRVLEGTPSHDRRQPRQFEMINHTAKHGVDLKYVDTLSIEYVKALDIHVLYVPDEWDHDPNDTWESVKGLLDQHGLTQVDFACMHGQFEYHLPEHLKLPSHLSERYLSITKYYIFIGHIHFTSVHQGRILTAGSFDRMTHGEEGPKGHFRVTVSVDGKDDEIEFRENVDATKYLTIDCIGLSLQEAMDKIDEYKTLPEGSHLRIQCTPTSEIKQGLPALREKYPQFYWKTKVLDIETEGQRASAGLMEKFEAVDITQNNIDKLLRDKLASMGRDEQRIAQIMTLLSRVA